MLLEGNCYIAPDQSHSTTGHLGCRGRTNDRPDLIVFTNETASRSNTSARPSCFPAILGAWPYTAFIFVGDRQFTRRD